MIYQNIFMSVLLSIPIWVYAYPYYPNQTTITSIITVTTSTPCPTSCSTTSHCGNGKLETDLGEECDLGPLNGTPGCTCGTDCKLKKSTPDEPPVDTSGVCAVCNPIVGFNKCHITTSCTALNKKYFCACRAGYRADGLSPTDSKQFRLKVTGQEYRVFVAPGVGCDTLCTNPHPGPDSCKEVPVKNC